MDNIMQFPETFEEFAKSYGFKDSKEIYTNGSELIPVFRVEQWLEHARLERTCEIVHDDVLSEQFEGPMSKCLCCGAALPEEFIDSYYYCPCCGSKNKVVDKVEPVPIKQNEGTFEIYDAEGDLVGKVNEDTSRAIIGNSFWVRECTCKYVWDSNRNVWFCSECGGLEPLSNDINYCCDCGARVINDAN